MLRISLLISFLCVFSVAHADDVDWFFTPSVGVVSNSVQGTEVRLGLDLGLREDNFFGGIGGYYGAGNHPSDDREIGVGPFVGYVYPVFSFMSLQLREDIDYVDQRDPVLVTSNPEVYTHTQEYGMISSTYGGVHFSFTRNFGLSAGYRGVIGLSKASLANGRSGVALGITIGI